MQSRENNIKKKLPNVLDRYGHDKKFHEATTPLLCIAHASLGQSHLKNKVLRVKNLFYLSENSTSTEACQKKECKKNHIKFNAAVVEVFMHESVCRTSFTIVMKNEGSAY